MAKAKRAKSVKSTKSVKNAIKEGNLHEHWVKKSAVVALIATVLVTLGAMSLVFSIAGHMTNSASIGAWPFWIAIVALAVVAILVDYAKNNSNKVFWVEDLFGGIFGALGYYGVFSLVGVFTASTIGGFVGSLIVLFVLFYVGFVVGNWVDYALLKRAGININ